MFSKLAKFGALLCICCLPMLLSAQVITQKLHDNWEFRQFNLGKWLPATVPGTVHTDLMDNKLIEDPFYRDNEEKVQWVDKVNWEYRSSFTASKELLAQQNQELIFHGLDTWCEVFLNDELLGETNNMFRTWTFNVTGKLKVGENQLRVKFYSPIAKGLTELENYGLAIPASNDYSQFGGMGDVRVSVYMRKAPYHFGWDWGPRLVTSGIWRSVELKGWSNARITDVFIKQPTVTAKEAKLIAAVEFQSDDSQKVQLQVKHNNRVLATTTVDAAKGNNNFEMPFTIRNPRLWWSAGLGEPNLYDFTVEAKSNGKVLATNTVTTGLRSIKLVRNKDEKGESFGFELNGVPVFIKGANAIPSDNFLPRVTKERYEKVVQDAVDANMNMIRIWGGGIYEDDMFYDACDRNGIMVWQDFAFACAMYPGDSAFVANVKQEAIDNIKRLRNRASLALWCGNNEIDLAWRHSSKSDWGWKKLYTHDEREQIFAAYVKIFHEMLPEIIGQYTDGDDYWPSSPMAGPGINQHNVYTGTSGDNHYWGVWHESHDFEKFRDNVGRFMSEYGFQSFPGIETVNSYTIPEDHNIESKVMANHQRSGIGNLRIREYMNRYYRVPEDFEQFLYMSQVLQADAMQMALETHRAAMPYCGGSLLWQLNDCWPVASWSTTDYYHRWKASHYATRDACKAQKIVAEWNDSIVKLTVINDKLQALNAQYEVRLMDFNGNVLRTFKGDAKTAANATGKVLELPVAELLQGADVNSSFIHIALRKGKEVIDENIAFGTRFKNMTLPTADIKTRIVEEKGQRYLEAKADKLAMRVYFYTTQGEVNFTENYINMLPGRTYKVPFTGDLKMEDLKLRRVE
ncbi:MAG: beta-mannosidase [Marinifilaceae bacterium]